VSSIASHSTLQYFPDVTGHEQGGCAHLLLFSAAIFFSKVGSFRDLRVRIRTPTYDSPEQTKVGTRLETYTLLLEQPGE
jgi:hypothetical protein